MNKEWCAFRDVPGHDCSAPIDVCKVDDETRRASDEFAARFGLPTVITAAQAEFLRQKSKAREDHP